MSKIRVKNFGPIKEGFNENDGFLDIKKVTVFIGSQGSGKSTVAKLISTCKWLEKSQSKGTLKDNLEVFDIIKYLGYQGIHHYYIPDLSELEYSGDEYSIQYETNLSSLTFKKTFSNNYSIPKLMYVPAERNFLSVIKNAFDVEGIPKSLFTFAEEFRRAQKELESYEVIDLPIGSYKYRYDDNKDISYVVGSDYTINLLQASSGLQSAIPLYLVSRNLLLSLSKEDNFYIENLSVDQSIRRANEIASVLADNSFTENEKEIRVRKVKSKYYNSCFINIVEEPEQNLFPESQRHILNSLLGFANKQEANELLMTTHSPYIINYLSIAIQGKHLLNKINASPKKDELLQRLNKIVPIEACVAAEDVAIYQFQNDGTICCLGDYEGIPSDKNYLNQSLAKGNELFDALLELEEEL